MMQNKKLFVYKRSNPPAVCIDVEVRSCSAGLIRGKDQTKGSTMDLRGTGGDVFSTYQIRNGETQQGILTQSTLSGLGPNYHLQCKEAYISGMWGFNVRSPCWELQLHVQLGFLCLQSYSPHVPFVTAASSTWNIVWSAHTHSSLSHLHVPTLTFSS